MSVLEWRGGFPVIFSGTVATTGAVTGSGSEAYAAGDPILIGVNQQSLDESGRKGPITSKWMRIANLGATGENLRIYFSQKHFDDNVHYATLLGDAGGLSVWEGPAEVHPSRNDDSVGVWVRSTAGAPAFDITAFHRRG